MTQRDDDRIAYLSGEQVESLDAAERAELDALRALLDEPSTWVEPDPGLEGRVVAAVAAAAAEAGVEQAAEAAAPPPRRQTPRRFRLQPPALRPAFAFGGVAAAIAVAVVIAVSAGGGSNRPAPLRFAMVVSGTPLAPGARGSAALTKTESGWRIELSATGLRRLDGTSFYYQAWLKNAAGTLVPVGTFNDALHVTLWSGVPVTKYRTLTVTIQPANGDAASSGRRVLVGTITPSR